MKEKRNPANTGKVQLSEHFSLNEFIYSRTAIDKGIDNSPPPDAISAMKVLCSRLLEPLRALCGNKPMHVLSGFRCEELNRCVGGVSNSQHLTGEAADIYMVDFKRLLLTLRSANAPEFDQVIFYTKKNFVHLSYSVSGRNRRMLLTKPG